MAISFGGRLREGRGSFALLPFSEGGSAEKLTSSSGSPANARTAVPTARLNGSAGFSGCNKIHLPLAGRSIGDAKRANRVRVVRRMQSPTRNALRFDLPARGR